MTEGDRSTASSPAAPNTEEEVDMLAALRVGHMEMLRLMVVVVHQAVAGADVFEARLAMSVYDGWFPVDALCDGV